MARTLVFDLGGVVLRWQPAELLHQQLPHRAPNKDGARELASRFFESFRPGSDWTEFDRGALTLEQVAPRIASRLQFDLEEVLRVMHAVPAHLQLLDDTAMLLRDLHRAGHRLVYLSNMPAAYVEHAEQQLDGLGVFDTGLYSSRVGMVKPQPRIFAHAEEQFGAKGADCIFFDDSPANVQAAAERGWLARHFSSAAPARADLIELGVLPASIDPEPTDAGAAGATATPDDHT